MSIQIMNKTDIVFNCFSGNIPEIIIAVVI